MAKFESPVKLQRGEVVREVANDLTFNQLVWDGFALVEGETIVRAGDGTQATSSSAKADVPVEETMTPAQKAAATRRANKAAKEAEERTRAELGTAPADEPEASLAASGGTAASETTVGTNGS